VLHDGRRGVIAADIHLISFFPCSSTKFDRRLLGVGAQENLILP